MARQAGVGGSSEAGWADPLQAEGVRRDGSSQRCGSLAFEGARGGDSLALASPESTFEESGGGGCGGHLGGTAANLNHRVVAELVDDRFRAHLVATAAEITRNADDAEDAVQEALAAAIHPISGLARADNPVAYLRVAVMNRARTFIARRRPLLSLDNPDAERTTPVGSSGVSVEEAYLFDDELPAALPAHLRPVWERRCRGMTLQAIAADLGLSLRTVERRWTQIKDTLRTLCT